MGKIGKLFHWLLQPKQGIFTLENRDGIVYANGNRVAEVINENKTFNFNFADSEQFEEVYESIRSKECSIELKENIIPIESLLSEGKFQLAIRSYEKVIDSPKFNTYPKDEKFLVYNGLLNCHINNDSDEDIIKHWIVKIEALGTDVKEIHRFYFLLAIWNYNKRELDKALMFVTQSLNSKPDYINAITSEILFRCNLKLTIYDKAKKQFAKLLRNSKSIKDSATIYSSFGELAFNNKDFSLAKENISKSNDLSKSITKEIAIAICEYFESFKIIKADGRVDFENINFDILKAAEEKFDKIYKNRTSDTIQTIVRMGFTFWFNTLTLTNNFSKILLIYDETKEYITKSMVEAIKYIAEAEAAFGILDNNLLENMDEYDKVKYKALYLHRTKDYEQEIDLLTPVIEGRYRDDKLFQFSYLNALKETNQFERYMEYYKRFSGHQDDLMRMNYIQFLMQLGKKDQVLTEIEKLKTMVQNPLVLYDMLVIYLEYKLKKELDDYFIKVDNGEYKIIEFQKPFVFYNKMIHLLNIKKYEEYFKLYEDTNLSFLNDTQKAVLKINYYTFKGNYDEMATSLYELFQLTGNHNDLMQAVQITLDINKYYEAEFYLKLVNPEKIEKPEFYYMFKAIILKENGKIDEALDVLNETTQVVDIDLESPFHQFYTAFNMNNGRTDDAVRYMSEYYIKNPNPSWFKVIQHSLNDTGEEIIKKLEAAVGGKRDLSQINSFFNKGIIGLSAYNYITGIAIENILYSTQYPYTKVHISKGSISKTMSDAESFDNKLLIDATTLTILSEVNALNLLDVFEEVLTPYSTLQMLKQRKSGIFRNNLNPVLEYIKNSPHVKNVPVEEGQKIKGNSVMLIPEDILDCISLSENLSVPFLNTEVAVNIEFNSNNIVDMNSLFFYLKKTKPEVREQIAEVIAKLRKLNFEFLSFDANDMFIVYSRSGIEGIKPFLKMGIDADYNSFNPAYIEFLAKVKNEKKTEEFQLCAREIISFMDKYFGKTRYYMYCIICNHPAVEESFERLIKKPSVKEIFSINTTYNINARTALDYLEIIDSYYYQKILSISVAFVGCIIQFIALVKDNEAEKQKYIDFIKQNICVNDGEDIDYILHFVNRLLEERQTYDDMTKEQLLIEDI